MATFMYKPDWGTSVSVKPRVSVTKFGDGYESRVSDGLNTTLRSWDCRFKRFQEECLTIYTFLENMGGLKAFNWTDPDGYEGVWVCEEWSRSYDNLGWGTVSAVFREVPEQVSP